MPRTSSRLSGGGGLRAGGTQQQQQQPGIQTFARATKPGVGAGALAPTKKALDQKPPTVAVTSLQHSPSKKRKLVELENVGCQQQGTVEGEIGAEKTEEKVQEIEATPSKTLRFSELSVHSPRSGHRVSTRSSPSVRSQLRSSRVAVQTPETPSKRGRGSVKRSTPRSQSQQSTLISRPACLDDLLRLHLSFLKALTLHSTYHGAAAPAELRDFLRCIERLWKKRKVVVRDLQRLVWIWEQTQVQQNSESESTTTPSRPVFRIANYGLGRVCLERAAPQGGEQTDRIDETEWQEKFEQTLDLLWEKTLDSVDGNADSDHEQLAVHFVETLDLAPIHESLTPWTAFRKGQQRLQDLKGGVIRMKTEKLRATITGANDDAASKPLADAAPNRRKGLLDRIKNKELRQSTLPPPPSKEMLLRRAAIERVEDVASVLASLRPVGYVGTGIKAMLAAQRRPFQIPVIVQHVQDSARSPISQQEVEICLEVLARTDVVGHWVNIVPVNQVKMVVLKSCADVNPKDIGAQVREMRNGYDEKSVSST